MVALAEQLHEPDYEPIHEPDIFPRASEDTAAPDGETVTYGYDADGNLISVTKDGATTSYGYGEDDYSAANVNVPAHILTSITNGRGVQTITVGFDSEGRLTHLGDASGASAGFEYEIDGAALGLPAGSTVSTISDADGNPVQVVRDADGNTIRKMQRTSDNSTPTDKSDDLWQVTVYDYDAQGNQTAVYQPFVVDEAAGDRYTASPTVKQSSSTYDPDTGRLLSTTSAPGTPQAATTTYTYDALGRLSSVTQTWRKGAAVADPKATTYTYNADGQQVDEINAATDITQQVTYGALGRALSLTDFQDANGDGIQQTGEATIAQFTYTYDKAGNRTSAVEMFDQNADGTIDHQQKFTWHYDNLNRLIVETFDDGNNSAADADDYITRYTFDLASNRTSVTTDTGNYDNSAFTADTTATYTYDQNDRLLSVEKSGANTQYTEYTYTGTQQTSKTVWTDNTKTTKVSQTTYEYNAQGRMSKTQIDSNGDGTIDTTIEYTYSDDGLRVTTTQDGVTTVYLFDRDNPTGYAQVLEQGTDTNHDGKLQAGEIDKTFIIGQNVIAVGSAVQTNQLLAFLYDLHGSTRALVNTNGQIDNDSAKGIQAFTYDAYGNMITTGFGAATQADALTNLLYSGQYTNSATGLQYLRSRYYDPSAGRFTRMDTYAGNVTDPLSLNKYAYANGNPIMMSDPSGRLGISITNIAVTAGILSMINGAIGGALGGIQDGAIGALGGFVGGSAGTTFGIYAATVFGGTLTLASAGALAPFGVAFGFGLGAALGTVDYLTIVKGWNYVISTEGKIQIGVSLAIGTLLGGIGGGDTLFLAKSLSKKILSIPSLRQEMIRAASGEGIYLKSFYRFATYYVERPSEFFRVVSEYIRPELLYSLEGAAQDALVGLFSGKPTTNLVYSLMPLLTETTQAFQKLINNFNKDNNNTTHINQ